MFLSQANRFEGLQELRQCDIIFLFSILAGLEVSGRRRTSWVRRILLNSPVMPFASELIPWTKCPFWQQDKQVHLEVWLSGV